MFRVKVKRGIAPSFLPREQSVVIETEEQLEDITNTFETEKQLEETFIISEKKLSGGNTENYIPKKNNEENLNSIMPSH